MLVELSSVSPNISLDIRYATKNNFTGKVLYPFPSCHLQRKCAERLHRVQLALEKIGLGLKVFDAYRPLSIQKILWDILPDPRYVADPARGSNHNRGAAVDLTLIDREGQELPMPSGFDEFTERAHRDFAAPLELLKNRNLLEEAMTKEGFLPLFTEWWHFDDPDWMEYPLLDVSSP